MPRHFDVHKSARDSFLVERGFPVSAAKELAMARELRWHVGVENRCAEVMRLISDGGPREIWFMPTLLQVEVIIVAGLSLIAVLAVLAIVARRQM
jgi:hypothetical protein